MKRILMILLTFLFFGAHAQSRLVHIDKETVYKEKPDDKTPGYLIKNQDTITVYKKFKDYWSASYNGNVVYIKYWYLKEINASAEEEQKKKETADNERYKKQILTKYGSLGKLILQGKVKLGMTKEMVVLSWGKPDDIHKTILRGSVTEQWVYNNDYLYFTNGILDGMQN